VIVVAELAAEFEVELAGEFFRAVDDRRGLLF
jgi:hypothetical protein